MSNPYDLNSGNKGYRAVCEEYRKKNYLKCAKHLRNLSQVYDSMSDFARNSERSASVLEQKALKIEEEMKKRQK